MLRWEGKEDPDRHSRRFAVSAPPISSFRRRVERAWTRRAFVRFFSFFGGSRSRIRNVEIVLLVEFLSQPIDVAVFYLRVLRRRHHPALSHVLFVLSLLLLVNWRLSQYSTVWHGLSFSHGSEALRSLLGRFENCSSSFSFRRICFSSTLNC